MMKTPSARYLSGIQALRGLAALAVVLFHVEGQLKELVPFERVLSHFAWSGVDLFFVISGFVMVWMHWQDRGNPARCGSFIRARLIRIYPAYLSMMAGVSLLYGLTDFQSRLNDVPWVASFSLLIPLSHLEHLLPVAWTLNYELLFYGFFALLIVLPKRIGLSLLALWCVSVAVAQTQLNYHREMHLQEFFFASYHFEFMAGMLVAWLARRRDVLRFGRSLLVIGLAGLVATTLLSRFVPEGGLGSPDHRDLRGICYALVYGCVLYGVVALELQKRLLRLPVLLLKSGDASYAMYLLHVPLLYLWHQAWLAVMPAPMNLLLLAVVYGGGFMVLCLPLSIAFHLYVEKPMMRMLKTL
jgi:peptidoglycan/LPS O-acetylase OafA/YrhL